MLEFAFSPAEYQRRRAATLALAAECGADRVLAFGENRSGVGVTYLTGWPVTRSAAYLVDPADSRLWVAFHNHLPAARRTAVGCEVRDVDAGTPAALLDGAGAAVATLGPVPPAVRALATETGTRLVPIDAAHAVLRQVKSAEEVEAVAAGARASDIGAQALVDACRPGATDWDLVAAARSAYTRAGARDHICYVCVTDMHAPDRDVPAQVPEGRVLRPGSVVTFELSAAVAAEYPGQVLRTVTLGPPTDQYADLHRVAAQVRDAVRAQVRAGASAAALVDASGGIEAAGYATTDDLFHGLGMGYLEPIGTSASRIPGHRPEQPLRAGMTIVVQPNVTTVDHRAGVQTGELVVVTDAGLRDVHDLPGGLLVV
ncbi:MAG: M24 family metallopeptidase [Candidatus Nanopelagicales bacterium]